MTNEQTPSAEALEQRVNAMADTLSGRATICASLTFKGEDLETLIAMAMAYKVLHAENQKLRQGYTGMREALEYALLLIENTSGVSLDAQPLKKALISFPSLT